METKRLPAQWAVLNTPIKRHNRISIVDAGDCHIACISVNLEDQTPTYKLEEKKAHAHLIAAAPELLAALEIVQAISKSDKEAIEAHGFDFRSGQVLSEWAIEKIEAAIAKAKGQ